MFFFKSLLRLLECKNFNSNGYFFNILAHETKTFKAPFKASDVHEQCGISFRTPPFPEQDINSQILVSCDKENISCTLGDVKSLVSRYIEGYSFWGI